MLRLLSVSALQWRTTTYKNSFSVIGLATDEICRFCQVYNVDGDHLQNYTKLDNLPVDISDRYVLEGRDALFGFGELGAKDEMSRKWMVWGDVIVWPLLRILWDHLYKQERRWI
ncbi:hypothetical protein NPIL_492021 [Nephila pilipes]|uniref:Uncharacterized protein n=1 Tax=Nephila pilipes TaxID=299642 RepID=A0A8X6MXZ7_NEPPI|nr:hypothetical protein NPIL_492021 [Nephila pilipes]